MNIKADLIEKVFNIAKIGCALSLVYMLGVNTGFEQHKVNEKSNNIEQKIEYRLEQKRKYNNQNNLNKPYDPKGHNEKIDGCEIA